MFSKVMIANRGEIAARIAQACTSLGVTSVAVYDRHDAAGLHVELADEAIRLPDVPGRSAYLDADSLVQAALDAGADAVHPGYGFLAENADFTRAVIGAGLVFVGPSAETIALLGDKPAARRAAAEAGIPVIPGSTDPVGLDEVVRFGRAHGWPVLVKAALGGGGRGMRLVQDESQAAEAYAQAEREARTSFGSAALFVEQLITDARHIEVQVIADTHGHVVAVGDRDCSTQRRHQKLLEEAPAPGLSDELRSALADDAVRIARRTRYTGAGTIEFLVRGSDYWFLEANPRIQVEHPITEAVTGVDIVVEQLRIAAGLPQTVRTTPTPRRHAIEVRINAEDPFRGFLPCAGRLVEFYVPHRVGVRFDPAYRSGDEVSSAFDSLLGKLVVHGSDRVQACRRTIAVLEQTRISGLPTTVPAALAVLRSAEFGAATVTTTWFESVVDPALRTQSQPVAAAAQPGPQPATSPELVTIGGRDYLLPTPGSSTSTSPTRRSPRAGPVGGSPAGLTPADGSVRAPVAGTVTSVQVATGDRVETGTALLLLEAMKMENVIRSAGSGVVEHIGVTVGAAVEAGQLLLSVRAE